MVGVRAMMPHPTLPSTIFGVFEPGVGLSASTNPNSYKPDLLDMFLFIIDGVAF
jgi:hypothetical protein